jgi:hypothetical protein
MGDKSLPIEGRNHRAHFQGREVDNVFMPDRAPGDWKLTDSGARRGEERILIVCPCGCDSLMSLRVTLPGAPPPADGGPAWAWNGDRGRPTLTPSIRDVGGCRFHGHLTGGTWTFVGDSGLGATR